MECFKKIILLFGPTASGKSSLALKLAQENNGVIFNADSMQIYGQLPILSSQPNNQEIKQIPHFLYGFLDFTYNFSVAKWLEMITPMIKEQINLGKKCFIVGGTGLYFSSLYYGINKIPNISTATMEEISDLFTKIKREEFIKYLQDIGDDNVELLDRQRLIRRAAVLKETGKSLKFWQDQKKQIFFPKDYFQLIYLNLDRKILYKNCDDRFDQLIKNGALDEVKNLMKLEIDDKYLITKTIGYTEIKNYLLGEITKEEMLELAKRKTRNYAKRQITWFNNQLKY